MIFKFAISVPIAPQAGAPKVQIRFAEDVTIPKSLKPDAKLKKGKKKGPHGKGNAEDGIKSKKLSRAPKTQDINEEEEY